MNKKMKTKMLLLFLLALLLVTVGSTVIGSGFLHLFSTANQEYLDTK